MTEKKKCLYCGKEFEPTDFRQKYCSPECRIKYTQERQRSKRVPEIVGKVIKCAYCGTEFTAKTVQSKYCCRECFEKDYRQKKKDENRAKRGNMVCEICGKTFEAKNIRKKYCSPKCADKAKRQRTKAWHQEHANAKSEPRVKPPKMSISEICRLAMAEHLTYGQYVEKYGV